MGRLAHAVALENNLISADVVEAQEFPSLSSTYGVRSVPMTVINELTRFVGGISEADFVDLVLKDGVKEPAG
ncbi:MAG: hypothetical protein FJ316_04625 [SAR202 cluster bacterium]|nr:hypothetical protein [SAR202 cluster bacterium]